jgi:PAS domain S-box-containing protein
MDMEMPLIRARPEKLSTDVSGQRARDLLRVLDHSSIVAFTDVAGRITYVNDKFCEVSQYSREELIGQNHRMINSKKHPPEFWLNFWKTISSGRTWKGEIRNQAKDGSYYWLFTTVVPLLDEAGKPRQYVSIRYEITDQKKLELESYQSNVEVEELKLGKKTGEKFVSMLAHDLRTPLTAARISADMILRQPDPSEKTAKYARRIVDGLERAESMISHLLDASKVRADELALGEMKECDLAVEVGMALEVLRIIYGERFRYEAKGNFKGTWDQAGIRRITENLCSNAIKYGTPNRPVYVELLCETTRVCLTVSNDGALLSEEDQKKIFQYMHRSSSANSGLNKSWGIGLAKVREVAEANGGTVEVESSEELGTKFIVRIPRAGIS